MENLTIKVGERVNIDGVNFHQIEGGFGEGKKCILAKEIANMHDKPLGDINKIIKNNSDFFDVNIDYIDLKSIESFKSLAMTLNHSQIYSKDSLNASKNVYLLSEQGYSMLVKLMRDEKSKEIHKKLVRGYFNMRKELKEQEINSYMISDPIERAKRWIEEEKQRQLLAGNNKKLEKEVEYKEDVIVGLVDDIDLATKRQRLNQIIRKCSPSKISDRWRLLYSEFERKYHINLTTRFKRNKDNFKPKLKNKLDYIDRGMEKIPELYELACKVFENNLEELKKEWFENTSK